ncbi:hypothetical protein [Novosphingobium resinovorum]|uniref:hypothetical protein n=1 Tax=Novosphingobium resinovorum TaxID=158500 RepID=UPI002ED6125C|nr:hypothetical protein [Novosphingobium resinovorum]
MKNKTGSPIEKPALSPEADAAILRLARLLGRQMARELHEEHTAKQGKPSEEAP